MSTCWSLLCIRGRTNFCQYQTKHYVVAFAFAWNRCLLWFYYFGKDLAAYVSTSPVPASGDLEVGSSERKLRTTQRIALKSVGDTNASSTALIKPNFDSARSFLLTALRGLTGAGPAGGS